MSNSRMQVFDLDASERDIRKLLNEVFLDKERYKPSITKATATRLIKQTIGSDGHKQHLDVCANGFADANCDREWLWDMIWYKMDDTGRTVSVPLVLESEMSLVWEDINYDFEKLLTENTDLRVLVCCTMRKDCEESIKADIDSYIKHFAESI